MKTLITDIAQFTLAIKAVNLYNKKCRALKKWHVSSLYDLKRPVCVHLGTLKVKTRFRKIKQICLRFHIQQLKQGSPNCFMLLIKCLQQLCLQFNSLVLLPTVEETSSVGFFNNLVKLPTVGETSFVGFLQSMVLLPAVEETSPTWFPLQLDSASDREGN